MIFSKRTNNRLIFNANCVARAVVPSIFYRRNFDKKLSVIEKSLTEAQQKRLAFYCNPNARAALADNTPNLRNIPKDKSTYYCDVTQFTRYFDPAYKIQTKFADIQNLTDLPQEGLTLLKSRPANGDTTACVLFKLNKVRHNIRIPDRIAFADKRDRAVWRGSAHTAQRRQATRDFENHEWIDIGHTSPGKEGVNKPRISIADQLNDKFILSLQGHDLATNLHWAMASNSVCVMPRPQNEGWSMESRMIPDVHYICVQDDLSDLEEKLEYYRKHVREAEEISSNAQKYIGQFYDRKSEFDLQIMVLYRYFQQTGQM